jgi:hypothetical protein
MNGDIMYRLAMQQITERHEQAARDQLAREAAKAARAQRRSGRGRHASAAPEAAALPAIPDFPHELFAAAEGDAVPAPRPETGRGRHARSGR